MMNKVLHRAVERGRGEHGWLSTRYSFSFADWYQPSRMGFGALRVLNDDTIAPLSGFPMHSHRDMEIITVVTGGTVTHEDSLGNKGVVPAGDIQVMSAGTGVTHAEYNASPNQPLTLFQIWIQPEKRGVAPHYAQKQFSGVPGKNGLVLLAAPNESEGGLLINQKAYLYRGALYNEKPISYTLKEKDAGVYIFVISGTLEIAGEILSARDAIGISETKQVEMRPCPSAEVLIIEVPMGKEDAA